MAPRSRFANTIDHTCGRPESADPGQRASAVPCLRAVSAHRRSLLRRGDGLLGELRRCCAPTTATASGRLRASCNPTRCADIGWALRNLADAAAYYPDGSPMKAYLAQKVTNNLTWLDDYATSQDPVTNPFKVLWLDKRPDGPAIHRALGAELSRVCDRPRVPARIQRRPGAPRRDRQVPADAVQQRSRVSAIGGGAVRRRCGHSVGQRVHLFPEHQRNLERDSGSDAAVRGLLRPRSTPEPDDRRQERLGRCAGCLRLSVALHRRPAGLGRGAGSWPAGRLGARLLSVVRA